MEAAGYDASCACSYPNDWNVLGRGWRILCESGTAKRRVRVLPKRGGGKWGEGWKLRKWCEKGWKWRGHVKETYARVAVVFCISRVLPAHDCRKPGWLDYTEYSAQVLYVLQAKFALASCGTYKTSRYTSVCQSLIYSIQSLNTLLS